MSWLEYWNTAPTVYVSAKHRSVHYRQIANDLVAYLAGKRLRVLDFGCGDAECAAEVSVNCSHLHLCDGAEKVREGLAARYAGHSAISVVSPDDCEAMPAESIDVIVVNSVLQYLDRSQLEALLATWSRLLAPGGWIVFADVVPRAIGAPSDAFALLRFAATHGFVVDALIGLVRTLLSDYGSVRDRLGFSRYSEDEFKALLAAQRFAVRRLPRNFGHNQNRMAFEAFPSAASLEAESAPPPASAIAPRPSYGVAMATFMGVWLALCWPWLSGEVTIPYDAKAVFHSQLQFLANAIHSGQSPFWNPHLFVGFPQIADPQSLIFSPALLLALLSPAPSFQMLDAYVCTLLGIGGLSVLMLFRDRRWHPAGAVVAAIAFAFGGAAAWRIQHISQIQSYVFMSLGLWLLVRALERSSARWGALAGVAIGLMIVEPDQVALLSCYLISMVVAGSWSLASDPRASIVSSIRPLAVAAFVALAISILPVALTALFLAQSNRPSIGFAEAARGSLHPASLLTVFVGDLFAAADARLPYWGPYSESWDPKELTLSQNMSQLYFGILPATLILTAGICRRVLWDREIRVYAIGAIVALLYALGAFTPLYWIVYKLLPGVAVFRRPVDSVFLFGGLAAILSGYLIHRWLSGTLPEPTETQQKAEVGMLILVLACAVALAFARGHVLDSAAAIAVTSVLAAATWVLVRRREFPLRIPAALAVPALSGLLALDLAYNNGPNESTALPPSADMAVLTPATANETLHFLKSEVRRSPGTPWRDRIEVAGLGFDWQNAAVSHGFDQTLGYNPFRVDAVATALGARDYIAGWEQREFSPLFPSYRCVLANLLGLRFVATPVPIEQIDKHLRPGDLRLARRTRDGFVYENPNSLPRALFVPHWQAADTRRILATGAWPTFDPRESVVIDAKEAYREASLPAHPRANAKPAMVRIARYENTIVEIEVEAPGPGFVVLNDVWQSWWFGWVDGVPERIRRANVLFRALPVQAGHHVVRFEFQPLAGALRDLSATDEDRG